MKENKTMDKGDSYMFKGRLPEGKIEPASESSIPSVLPDSWGSVPWLMHPALTLGSFSPAFFHACLLSLHLQSHAS